MEPVIEKSVPIPDRDRKYGKNKELLKRMEVGDSVLFKTDDTASVLNRFYVVARRLGYIITIRRTAEGVRLWLVSKER